MTINDISILDILKSLNEPLIQKGKKVKWDKHHSIDINDNKWYRHSTQKGGYPIQFMMEFFDMNYKQSVQYLSKTFNVRKDLPNKSTKQNPKIPSRNPYNTRVEIYLKHFRFIDQKIIDHFINDGLLYESTKYNNCVFVGKDNQEKIRHIHERSIHTSEFEYKSNAYSSDSRWPFNHIGTNNKLYVFESPIDMLSYITLHKENWHKNSYVALCGLSNRPVLNMIETYPFLSNVILSLDNDMAGQEASLAIIEDLEKLENITVEIKTSTFKDFNEDLKFKKGITPIEGIIDPFMGYKDEILHNIRSDIVKRKQLTLRNLLDAFSIFLYTFESTSVKQRAKALNALIECATIAIKMAHQQSTHLEKNIPLSEFIDNRFFECIPILKYVDKSPPFSKFMQELDFLKKEFKLKIYHTASDKEEIIASLMRLAKTCVYTHVFLILKERKIHYE